MVKNTLLNYILIMSLFIQDKSTLYSDLLQSCDNNNNNNNKFIYIAP